MMNKTSQFLTLEYEGIEYVISKDSICHMYEKEGYHGIEGHLVLKSGKEFIYSVPLSELRRTLEDKVSNC